jgi:hypothetical protein
MSVTSGIVSHGRIDRKGAKTFLGGWLESEADEYRFDPHNRDHRTLVRQYRVTAQRAVSQALAEYV